MKLSEDKVREVLEPWEPVSDLIVTDGYVAFKCFCFDYEITEKMVHFRGTGLQTWSSMSHEEYCDVYTVDQGIRDLITLISSPSPTLEEQVREILKNAEGIQRPNVEHADPSNVVLKYKNNLRDVVYPNFKMDTYGGACGIDINDTTYIHDYKSVLTSISALLTPPEPTIESLQKRVEELEDSLETRTTELTVSRERARKLHADNVSLNQILDERDATIKNLQTEKQDLEDQLQGCVSQNDHEDEIADLLRTIDEHEETIRTCQSFDMQPQPDRINELIVDLVSMRMTHEEEMNKCVGVVRAVSSGPTLDMSEGKLHV